MRYFFDNCISPRFAKMLCALDISVVALREECAEDISDVDLFAFLKGKDFVLLTADSSQTTRQHEAKALKESGVSALFLNPFWSKLGFWPQANWLIAKWPRIDEFACQMKSGTCAAIHQNGSFSMFSL